MVVGCSWSALAADPPAVDYARDVQPIFQQHCYQCHDARKQRASLRLDVRSRALRGGESGKAAVVPGDSGKSELIRRINLAEGKEAMPPGSEKLTAAQVKLLRAWIDGGAKWPDALANEGLGQGHWAFQPPRRPPLPEVRDPQARICNPTDRFILARLEELGLRPSPPADRVTLLRRLSLDLIGLPPSIAEVDAFLKESDAKPQAAYEAVVERLLASPHYGERWGRHWLDAARYADSDGFEKDKPRQVWFYRDWVINALNRDLPYDQFIIEQIAGDLLPNATQDQIVATGFLRNSMINEEGGVDPEQFRMEAMFDRMDAIGKSILGLTIQCAQCHNHKFDPLTQDEYYRLFAFLNNDHEANIAVYTPDEQMQRAEIFRQIRDIEDELRHQHPDWQKRMARLGGRRSKDDQPEWTGRAARRWTPAAGRNIYLLADGSILAAGLCADEAHDRLHGQDRRQNDHGLPPGTAQRSEPAAGRAGPVDLWACAPDASSRSRPAPADEPARSSDVKIVKATADVNPPETAAGSRSSTTRAASDASPARSPSPSTARTKPPGASTSAPAAAIVPRKAVFVLREADRASQGRRC